MKARAAATALLVLVLSPIGTAAEQVDVNGITMTIERATGAAAAQLIERHLASDPRGPDGARVPWRNRDDWRELASLRGRSSQVLQVRGTRDSLEAVLSTVPFDQTPRDANVGPLRWLTRVSVANHVVTHGEARSEQWILRSAWSPGNLLTSVRMAARLEDWRVESEDASNVLLSRRTERLQWILLPGEGSTRSVAVVTGWTVR